jgi:hypothetical protein
MLAKHIKNFNKSNNYDTITKVSANYPEPDINYH